MADRVPRPMGRYVPAVTHRGLVTTAGMTPRRDGVLVVTGRVGDDLDLDGARRAAGIAAENAFLAAAEAAGGAGRIVRLVSMTVYVRTAEGFTELSAVADGASEALASLTENALVARTTIGVAELPGAAPVEVQLAAAYDEPGAGGLR